MPKAIAHPTDSRLLESSRQHLVKAAEDNGLRLLTPMIGVAAVMLQPYSNTPLASRARPAAVKRAYLRPFIRIF